MDNLRITLNKKQYSVIVEALELERNEIQFQLKEKDLDIPDYIEQIDDNFFAYLEDELEYITALISELKETFEAYERGDIFYECD